MFYIKEDKLFKLKKKQIINLTKKNKINLSLILFAYLNNTDVKGYKKRKFKKWFILNKKEILDFYNEKDDGFFNTFFSNNNLQRKLDELFSYDINKINELIKNNHFSNDDPYNEFIKIIDNFYNLIDFLREFMVINFNEFFMFLNFILFPRKRSSLWK